MRTSFLRPLVLLALPFYALLAQNGSVQGTVTHQNTGEAIPSVNVRVTGTPFGSATDQEGRFTINNLPPGTYLLKVTAVGHRASEASVVVSSGSATSVTIPLVDEAVRAEDVLIYGASLRRERITDAPAAVSVIDAKQIVRRGGSGQLPKLLESEPGIDIAQNGLFDFNINTRGFNSSLNRRVLVLLDGRDLGTAFLGATEWNGLSTPLEDLGNIEMIRGPGSALYGANAYNGVMNITSMAPRSSLGTKVIVGVGELEMFRGDVRHAGAFGAWSYKVNAGMISGKTFTKNRFIDSNGNGVRDGAELSTFEYDGFNVLNAEAIVKNDGPVSSTYGAARIDYEFISGAIATLEGGYTLAKNEVVVTGIGRVQALEARRPWLRFNYRRDGMSFNAWTNSRLNGKPDKSLSTGLDLTQDATISQAEFQYATTLFNGLQVVGGVSQRFLSIDTKGSLMQNPRDDNMTGVFAQVEYGLTPDLKVTAAGRWDRSTLHESQFSPKAAVVWTFIPLHSIRATFNQAFQSPNYSELYLNVDHPTRFLYYYGNPNLQPEKITGFEIGYKGVFSESFFLTADVYFNILTNFVTDLSFVRNDVINGVANAIWSYGQAGEVNEAGMEMGINYYLSTAWLVDLNVSLFSFEIVKKDPNDFLIPNAPRYKVNGGITYFGKNGLDVGLKVKHVPAFDWAAGIYKGEIKTYTLVNVSASYPISNSLGANLSVTNLFDSRHHEIFGGSILGRRSILTLAYTL